MNQLPPGKKISPFPGWLAPYSEGLNPAYCLRKDWRLQLQPDRNYRSWGIVFPLSKIKTLGKTKNIHLILWKIMTKMNVAYYMSLMYWLSSSHVKKAESLQAVESHERLSRRVMRGSQVALEAGGDWIQGRRERSWKVETNQKATYT